MVPKIKATTNKKEDRHLYKTLDNEQLTFLSLNYFKITSYKKTNAINYSFPFVLPMLKKIRPINKPRAQPCQLTLISNKPYPKFPHVIITTGR